MNTNTIHRIRKFNRLYTNIIGLLDSHILNSSYSLTEARILYEIGHKVACTASMLINEINLDPGYVSRILHRFEKDGLVARTRSPEDKRIFLLNLTAKGSAVLFHLTETADQQIQKLVQEISPIQQQSLIHSMDLIEDILTNSPKETVTIRPSKPGDLGQIISRHAFLYEKEYNFDSTFENYVLLGIAKYLENYDSDFDKIWIAENNGNFLGSVGIQHLTSDSAQLRWFLLEPEYRGKGIGKKLLNEAVSFSKDKYKHLILWTISYLESARYLYERYGFKLTEKNTHTIWGSSLTEEKWELFF